MKSKPYFLKSILAGIFAFLLVSCGQNSGSENLKTHFSVLKPYQSEEASFRLFGQMPGNGDVSIFLTDDRNVQLKSFVAISGSLDISLEDVNANEIYFLKISGMNENTGYWTQEVPLFVTDGAEFELIADTESVNPGDPHYIKVSGGDEEQQFLEEWKFAVYNQVIPLNEEGNQFAAYKDFNQEFIEKGRSLISTFYLISLQKNYRDHLDAYSDLYLQSAPEVQNSKYGVDFANHVHRITHAPTKIDFSKILTARNSRLLPFEPGAFAEKEYLVLYIWASWDPKAVAQLEEVAGVVRDHENAALLHFSLDTRMSDWKPLSDQMGLENSYMVRAETRQASIDQLYLTALPRIIVVRPNGQIVEHELSIEQLREVLANL